MRPLRTCFATVTIAAAALSGCQELEPLPDTLRFPPGTTVEYRGKPAKMYGTSQCAQGQLTGNSCLIFEPQNPRAKATVIRQGQVHELELIAKRDPRNPVKFVVQDAQGHTLLSSTGRDDDYIHIQIAP